MPEEGPRRSQTGKRTHLRIGRPADSAGGRDAATSLITRAAATVPERNKHNPPYQQLSPQYV